MRRGFSITEMIIGVLILGAALVPIYSIFISSSKAVSSSKLAYMAMQLARETMEELRQVPWAKIDEMKTSGFVPVGDTPLFKLTAKARSAKPGDDDPNGVTRDGPKYTGDYVRIKYQLKIEDVGEPEKRLKKASLDVQWDEQGGRQEKDRSGMLHFVTILGYHGIDPEVPEP